MQDIKTGLSKTIIDHGYTIEVGLGQNPIPISQFNKIYNQNEGILTLGMIL